MFADTVACGDGVTFCNISVIWMDASKICREFLDCEQYPCNTTGCRHSFVPTPGYCQESQCWTDDKPIDPVIPYEFPWASVVTSIGSIVLVILLAGLGYYKRQTVFVQGLIKNFKKAGGGIVFGCLGCILLLVFPFLWIYQFFKAFFEMVYGRIRYRNEPENPERRNSIELEEIKESLRNNGCWPFHHGSVLLNQDSDEEDNSDIVRPGPSNEGRSELGIPGPSNQGRSRPTGKETSKAIIEEHDEFVANHAPLSNFSAYDSEDETLGKGQGYIEDDYVPPAKSD